jgi:hypothetical protein
VPATGTLATLALSLYAAGAGAEALPLLAALTEGLDVDGDPARASEALLAHADLLESSGEVRGAEAVLQRLVDRPGAPESAVERLAELRGCRDLRGAVTRWPTSTSAAHPRTPPAPCCAAGVPVPSWRPELADRLPVAPRPCSSWGPPGLGRAAPGIGPHHAYRSVARGRRALGGAGECLRRRRALTTLGGVGAAARSEDAQRPWPKSATGGGRPPGRCGRRRTSEGGPPPLVPQ